MTKKVLLIVTLLINLGLFLVAFTPAGSSFETIDNIVTVINAVKDCGGFLVPVLTNYLNR